MHCGGWPCLLMACKRSGVRIPIAPQVRRARVTSGRPMSATPDRAWIGGRKRARSGASLPARRMREREAHSRRASSVRCDGSGAGTMNARSPASAERARSARARARRDWRPARRLAPPGRAPVTQSKHNAKPKSRPRRLPCRLCAPAFSKGPRRAAGVLYGCPRTGVPGHLKPVPDDIQH
jgi:hypothetical protein